MLHSQESQNMFNSCLIKYGFKGEVSWGFDIFC